MEKILTLESRSSHNRGASGSVAARYAEGCRFKPDLGRYFFVPIFSSFTFTSLSLVISSLKNTYCFEKCFR